MEGAVVNICVQRTTFTQMPCEGGSLKLCEWQRPRAAMAHSAIGGSLQITPSWRDRSLLMGKSIHNHLLSYLSSKGMHTSSWCWYQQNRQVSMLANKGTWNRRLQTRFSHEANGWCISEMGNQTWAPCLKIIDNSHSLCVLSKIQKQ